MKQDQPIAHFLSMLGTTEAEDPISLLNWRLEDAFRHPEAGCNWIEPVSDSATSVRISVNHSSLRPMMKAGSSIMVKASIGSDMLKSCPALDLIPVEFVDCFDVPTHDPARMKGKWFDQFMSWDKQVFFTLMAEKFPAANPRETFVCLRGPTWIGLRDKCENKVSIVNASENPLPVTPDGFWIDPEILDRLGHVSGQLQWFSRRVWQVIEPVVDRKLFSFGSVTPKGVATWTSRRPKY